MRGPKDRLRAYAPRRLIYDLPAVRHLGRYLTARRAFAGADREPRWLPDEALPRLQAQSEPPRPYRYDPDAVARRAEVARARILHVIPPLARRGVRDTLELGALDAMTSGALAATGRRATAIDLKSGRLDPRARDAGVRFEVMDAEKLGFDDGSFDLVLSHNAFEHFHHPERVLEEALRVVRPGGFVYLDFGPLYLSPWGLHEYQSITVPYCHLLFPLDVLSRFARDQGLPALDPTDVNGWPLSRYRALWRRVAPRARILHHHERRLLAHLDLITAHPSCFRSDTDSFADLVVSNIEVLFRRA